MSYLRYSEKFGDLLISLDGIRCIQEVHQDVHGNLPQHEGGRIIYTDGFDLRVSAGCAQAVQEALKTNTVPFTHPKQD